MHRVPAIVRRGVGRDRPVAVGPDPERKDPGGRLVAAQADPELAEVALHAPDGPPPAPPARPGAAAPPAARSPR